MLKSNRKFLLMPIVFVLAAFPSLLIAGLLAFITGPVLLRLCPYDSTNLCHNFAYAAIYFFGIPLFSSIFTFFIFLKMEGGEGKRVEVFKGISITILFFFFLGPLLQYFFSLDNPSPMHPTGFLDVGLYRMYFDSIWAPTIIFWVAAFVILKFKKKL